MKLIDVEYTFDRNKVLFYFTADGRVDFRDLVKDLAAIFKTRIELRQIGVRDEAKMLGGLGVCGRHLCCYSFLSEFEPVSIKMAKEQNLSLNPNKISGACGRLMCCLKYEQDTYEEVIAKTPKINALVSTPQGTGVIINVSLLKETVKVKLDKDNENVLQTFHISEVKVLKDVEVQEDEDVLNELKHLEDM
jgi:cell fate regulator YaaT (PSP1 superfamily)